MDAEEHLLKMAAQHLGRFTTRSVSSARTAGKSWRESFSPKMMNLSVQSATSHARSSAVFVNRTSVATVLCLEASTTTQTVSRVMFVEIP